jgi:hypothetical protein
MRIRLTILVNFLIFVSSLNLNSPIYAAGGDQEKEWGNGFTAQLPKKKCVLCSVEIENTPSLQCKSGHATDQDCLKHQLASLEIASEGQAETIKKFGLRCYGEGAKCEEYLSLDEVQNFLGEEDPLIKDLKKRLKASREDEGKTDEDSPVAKTLRLRSRIEEAFNLHCPSSECSGMLAPIEGCNAATCEGCKTRFCYLCLKSQTDSTTNHAHARAHSGNYWENRDGHTGLVPEAGQTYQEIKAVDGRPFTYTDRYHWQIVRHTLEFLQEEEIDPSIKKEVLKSLKPLLEENKMWPMPVSRKIDSWIKKVNQDSSLDDKNKVALLQNELVYQNHVSQKGQLAAKEEASIRAEKLKYALNNLKAPILITLDVGAHQSMASNRHIYVLVAGDPDDRVNNLFHYLELHEPKFFDLGGRNGNLYRISDPIGVVAPFVLSKQYGRSYLKDATDFCSDVGGRLPTEEELRALIRALSPQGRYNPRLIPSIASGVDIWSSTKNSRLRNSFYTFDGQRGEISNQFGVNKSRFRCVLSVPEW